MRLTRSPQAIRVEPRVSLHALAILANSHGLPGCSGDGLEKDTLLFREGRAFKGQAIAEEQVTATAIAAEANSTEVPLKKPQRTKAEIATSSNITTAGAVAMDGRKLNSSQPEHRTGRRLLDRTAANTGIDRAWQCGQRFMMRANVAVKPVAGGNPV